MRCAGTTFRHAAGCWSTWKHREEKNCVEQPRSQTERGVSRVPRRQDRPTWAHDPRRRTRALRGLSRDLHAWRSRQRAGCVTSCIADRRSLLQLDHCCRSHRSNACRLPDGRSRIDRRQGDYGRDSPHRASPRPTSFSRDNNPTLPVMAWSSSRLSVQAQSTVSTFPGLADHWTIGRRWQDLYVLPS